jgi:hypothetical protein
MPKESRHAGKFPTHDGGETGASTRRERNSGSGIARNSFEEAFVSQKPVCAILLAFAFLATPAFAQSGAAPANDAPAATTKPEALTPDQARRALDTLQDEGKRAQMIETLRSIANASPQAQAALPAPEKPSAIPLTKEPRKPRW